MTIYLRNDRIEHPSERLARITLAYPLCPTTQPAPSLRLPANKRVNWPSIITTLDLVLEGHHEQAVEEYQKAVAADPKFTDALHGLSRALQDLSRFDEAIVVAQQISEIDPDDILAHTSLSILYQKKGMVPEAEAEGNKARVLGWKQQLKKGSG